MANQSDVHFLPCETTYDGATEVKSFFQVTPGSTPGSVLSAYRGHELQGESLKLSTEELPVRGLCITKEMDTPGDAGTKLRVASEFQAMTMWQHDAKPDVPHMRDFIEWFEISNAIHS